MKKIIHYLAIHAQPAYVYRSLTTSEGLGGWWSTDVTVEPGQGGTVQFRFLEHFNPRMEVTELEENRLVRWKCVDGHDNWLNNVFSFELHPEGSDTGLMFVQVYEQELDDDVYGTYNFNWGYYLGSLKLLCETGTGTPFEPD